MFVCPQGGRGGPGIPPRGGYLTGYPSPGGPGTPPGRSGYPPGGVPDWVPPWGGPGTPPGGLGTPPGGVPSKDNIGSICYTAGGMPLAFTQEDFLVEFVSNAIQVM